MKSPEKIVVQTIPDVSGSGRCKPYVEIINGTDFTTIWQNKDSMNLKTYRIYDAEEGITQHAKGIAQKMVMSIDQKLKLSSDLYFRLKHKGSFKNKLICRFALNTSFIDNSKYCCSFALTIYSIYKFGRALVDPDSIRNDPRFTDSFRVEIHFKNVCEKCTDASRDIRELCGTC